MTDEELCAALREKHELMTTKSAGSLKNRDGIEAAARLEALRAERDAANKRAEAAERNLLFGWEPVAKEAEKERDVALARAEKAEAEVARLRGAIRDIRSYREAGLHKMIDAAIEAALAPVEVTPGVAAALNDALMQSVQKVGGDDGR
jgi:hypothetical protein